MARILSRVAPWFPSAKSRRTPGEALTESIRVLSDADTPALRALIARDPVSNIFMDAQLDATGGAGPVSSGSFVLGRFDGGLLTSACWVGANLVPIEMTVDDAAEFARVLAPMGRHYASIFGPSAAVLGLWNGLGEGTQRAFDVREHQPLMVLDTAPKVAPDKALRLSHEGEFELLLPACAAMFEEELGYSPLAAGGSYYRSRVRSLMRQGHSLVDINGGEIRFKAELGTVSARATQIQGVWMNPKYRGQGGAAAYMSAVAGYALSLAPVTSLYVNDYNAAALATYKKVGFEVVGEFATVLF